MSRDVSWGIYIAQFTFLVGVAASAVMVVLPYYLHNVKAFGKITILGEFLAVAAVTMCLLFIIVDLGKPMRLLNVLLYPTPNSILFWDMIVLERLSVPQHLHRLECSGSGTQRRASAQVGQAAHLHFHSLGGQHPHGHGLPVRRSSRPALLADRHHGRPLSGLGLCRRSGPADPAPCLVKRLTKFDPGKEAIDKLSNIMTYAMIISVFFVGLEFFTAFYSNIPGHKHAFQYLFFGLEGHNKYVAWTWISVAAGVFPPLSYCSPLARKSNAWLVAACYRGLRLFVD